MLYLVLFALTLQICSLYNVFIYKNGVVIKRTVFAFAFLVYISFFIAITDTTDWKGYVYMFQHDEFPTDLMFRFLSNLAKNFGYEFIHVYKLHIILSGLFFINFLSKFTRNTIFIVFMLVLLSYVQLANQIRYFLGFSIFLNAYYYLNKRIILGMLLLILSIICHTGIIALILVSLPAMLIKSPRRLFIWMIAVATGITVFFKPVLTSIGLNQEKLGIYLGSDYSTSIMGTLFQVAPVIVLTLMSLILVRRRLWAINSSDESFILYRLATVSLTFLPISFISQIFFWRYTFPMLFVWALTIMCVQEKGSLRKIMVSNSYLFVSQIALHIYYWALPILILDSRDTLDKINLLVGSFALTN